MNWTVQPIDNFTLAEARCHGREGTEWHDCGLVILVPELCDPLAKVRFEFDNALIVKSWCRCKAHNLAVGGKKDSYHQNGRAVDITSPKRTDLIVVEAIARRYFQFVKRYSWGLHCDIRGERP